MDFNGKIVIILINKNTNEQIHFLRNTTNTICIFMMMMMRTVQQCIHYNVVMMKLKNDKRKLRVDS